MELGRDISKLVEWVSCKLVFPHRNTKKKKKKPSWNCQNQLCQNSRKQSEAYSNQVNAESRKKQLKNGKFCGLSICSYPTPSPGKAILERQQLCSLCWDPVPWFQKKQSRTCSHIIMHACSNLSGGYLKVLVSGFPNSDLRPEKQWALLENVVR